MIKKIVSLGIVLTGLTCFFTPAYAGSSCKPVVIQSKDKVRSTKIYLYEMTGGIIKKASVAAIEKKDTNFPLSMMDCGDSEHYFIRRNGAAYLIKQSDFKCIIVKPSPASGVGSSFAGAPGSGSANKDCPK